MAGARHALTLRSRSNGYQQRSRRGSAGRYDCFSLR